MISFSRILMILGSVASVACSLQAHADQTWSYTYNTLGLVETVDGPRTDVNDVTTYGYDAQGNLTSITDALGYVTQMSEHNSRGLPQRVIDPHGVETQLVYHPRGWLLSSIVIHPGGNLANNSITQYQYDGSGQLTSVTLPGGEVLKYEYDSARWLTAVENTLGERIEYTLDAAGNRTGEVIKNSNGDIKKTLTRAFDELNRVMDITGAAGQNTHLDYDKNDNNAATTNGRNFTTEYQFDALNRVKKAIDPYLEETRYDYDTQGRLKTVTDAKGLTTTYHYDAFDNLVQLDSPDTGLTDFTYDGADNRTSAIDSRGIIATYTYDALNRLISVSYPNNPSENRIYSYDSTDNGNYGIGRLTGITDISGQLNFIYNHLGQLVSKTYSISGESYTISYDYDLSGRVLSITYPSRRIVNYQRDELGRVNAITTRESSNAPVQLVVNSVSYLPFGPIKSFVYANGVSQQMQYDTDYRLTDNAAMGVQGILSTQYNYDANNNIEAIVDRNQATQSQSFVYDNVDRLSSAEGLYGQYEYSYDEVGNRTQRIREKSSATMTETYSYPNDSHRLGSIAYEAENVIGNRSFAYDEAGNLVGDTVSGAQPNKTTAITYNDANRPSEVTVSGSTIQYTHNSLGQRTRKASPHGVEHYHYNESGQLLAVTDETGNVKQEYIYLESSVVAVLVNQDGEESEPAVVIQSPSAGSDIDLGSSVTLAASAVDAEDGDISSQILWESSHDGSLGSGSSITISSLSLGQHVITARVSDSSNAVGSAAITISVVDPAIDPNDQDGDGLSDAWEIQHFGDTTYSPDGDFDNDSITNAEEYLAGTDPNFNDRANQLNPANTAPEITLSANNTQVYNPQSFWRSSIAFAPLNPGKKYYWEASLDANYSLLGIGSDLTPENFAGASAGSYGWESSGQSGNIYNSGTVLAEFMPYAPGDRLMLAYDPDAGKLWFGLNGVWQGSPIDGTGAQVDGITGLQYPVVSVKQAGRVKLYFSQTHFQYAPPAGFEASIQDDADHDDLQDEWELHYFGTLSRNGSGDFDMDGFSDLEEFNAGTDPTVPIVVETNLALNKSASQSSDYGPGVVASVAVDGNTANFTHTHRESKPWWETDLQEVSRVNGIKLFSRPDCCADRLSNVYVLVSDVPFISTDLNAVLSQPGVSAYFLSGEVPASQVVAIDRTARYIRVQLTSTNYLSLAEVEINGYRLSPYTNDLDSDGMQDRWELQYFGQLGRDGAGDFDNDGVSDLAEFNAGTDPTEPEAAESNLALNKPASQSSDYGPAVVASVAVDGDTATFTHTLNDANAWWEVDLEALSRISSIELFNRPDCCAERLSNVYVFVSEVPFNSTDVNTVLEQPGVSAFYLPGAVPASYVLSINRRARYIRVQLSSTNYLSLAEVIVNGYPL